MKNNIIIYLIAILLISINVSGFSGEDPLLYYDGTDLTVTDETGNGYTGTVVDNVRLGGDKNNVVSNAYHFDGEYDSINIPSNVADNITNTENFSVSFWFATNRTNPVINNYLIELKDGLDFGCYIETATNDLECDLRDSGNGNNYYNYNGLVDDTIYYFLFTYNGVKGRLYINGISVENITQSFYTSSTTNRITLARNHGSATLEGVIDEVAIFNYSLNDNEIDDLFICYDNCFNVPLNNNPEVYITSPTNTSNGQIEVTIQYKIIDKENTSLLRLWSVSDSYLLNTTTNPLNDTIYRSPQILSKGSTYRFIVEGCDGNNVCVNSSPLEYYIPNTIPYVTTISPTSGSTNISTNINLSFNVFDIDDNKLNVTIKKTLNNESNINLTFVVGSDGHQSGCIINSDYQNFVTWLNSNYINISRVFFLGDIGERNDCEYTAIENYVTSNLNYNHLFIGGNHDGKDYSYMFDDDSGNDWAADWHNKHTEKGYNFIYLNSTEENNAYNCTFETNSVRCLSTTINVSWVNDTLNSITGINNTFIFTHEAQLFIPGIDYEAGNNNTDLESVFQYHREKIISVISGHDHDNNDCHYFSWGNQLPIWRCFDGRIGGHWGVTKGYRIFTVYENGKITSEYIDGGTNISSQQHTLKSNNEEILYEINNIDNGTNIKYNYNNLDLNETYYWYIMVTDGYKSYTSDILNFTTSSNNITINLTSETISDVIDDIPKAIVQTLSFFALLLGSIFLLYAFYLYYNSYVGQLNIVALISNTLSILTFYLSLHYSIFSITLIENFVFILMLVNVVLIILNVSNGMKK